jgi:hypothetical protein
MANDKKLNRSRRLKKYRSVYEDIQKSFTKPDEKKEKSLTSYQKFVKDELSSSKYNNIPIKDRLKFVSIEWMKVKNDIL